MTRKVASPIATTPNIRNTNIHATGDDELMKGGPNMNRKSTTTDRYLAGMVMQIPDGYADPGWLCRSRMVMQIAVRWEMVPK
jgi:hypothetical protein